MTIIENEDISVVVIYWQIERGKEKDFENKWKELSDKIKDKGLIIERLSRVEQPLDKKWDTWSDIVNKEDTITYINVGLWRSLNAFKEAIESEPILEKQLFERYMRQRILLNPKWTQNMI